MGKPIKQKTEKMGLEEYLGKIVALHNLPCFVLIKIEKDHKFIVEGIAANNEALNLVLTEKESLEKPQDYMG